jgi:hypothetical protein
MFGTVFIPPNRRVNSKVHIVQPKIKIPPNRRVNIKIRFVVKPPEGPYGYNFDHFNRKQCDVLSELLDKIHDSDLDIFKFFTLYGIYSYEQKKKGWIDPLFELNSDLIQKFRIFRA